MDREHTNMEGSKTHGELCDADSHLLSYGFRFVGKTLRCSFAVKTG